MANYEMWKLSFGWGGTDGNVDFHAMMPVNPLAGTRLKRRVAIGDDPCWYIEGDGIKMMMDCGGASPNVRNIQYVGGRTATTPSSGLAEWGGGGAEELRWSLEEELGVKVEEIMYVVISHGHTGWSWNFDLFPNAQVIVNRQEIVCCWAPEPPHRFATSREWVTKLLCRKEPERLLILDGDYKIAPGLEIIFTAGHSHGNQAMLVQTVKGKVALSGEIGYLYGHLFPGHPEIICEWLDKPLPFGFARDTTLGHGIVDDPKQEVRAIERLRAISDLVVPYDHSSPKMIPEQWWDRPSVEYQKWCHEAYLRKYKPGISPDVLHLLERRKKSKSTN